MAVVEHISDRVAVMYAGEIIEETDARSLFHKPLHPYTQGLIGSVPVLGQPVDSLAAIPGMVPNLIDLPSGCRFAPRCSARVEHDVTPATEVHPELRPVSEGHTVRCWLYHSSDETPDWRPPLAESSAS
jgi:oligopeptide/dipeptide ABC transporter ATP-binding protein